MRIYLLYLLIDHLVEEWTPIENPKEEQPKSFVAVCAEIWSQFKQRQATRNRSVTGLDILDEKGSPIESFARVG